MPTPAALALALSLLAPPPPAAPDLNALEQQYLAARDAYVARFREPGAEIPDGADRRALAELELLLREAVGPAKVAGALGAAKINIETLVPDGGFGQLDALRFAWGDDTLLVTTRGLLDAFMATHPSYPADHAALSQFSRFYSDAFNWDVGFAPLGELPVARPRSMALAKASIAISSQDFGPSLPDSVVTFAERGNQVFLVLSPQRVPIQHIPACSREWDAFERRSREAPPGKRASQLEEEGFEAYRKCWMRSLRDQPFFPALMRQAQAIVDRLAP